MRETDITEVLEMLTATFGDGFDRRWHEWKHESGPWGPSPGWVAEDEDGLIGIRIFLPWTFSKGRNVYKALRPCDTVTVPRARGLGVFRRLTETAMDTIGDGVNFYYNTPNAQSRPGYLKMGFSEWTTVVQRGGAVIPRPARLDLPRLDAVTRDPEKMATATSRAFFDWRYRRCPRYRYEFFALENADAPNGVICRTRSVRGKQVLVISELWGSRREKWALIRAAAAEMSVRLVWLTDESRQIVPISVRRSATLVTRYDVSGSMLETPALSLGDIEDVL